MSKLFIAVLALFLAQLPAQPSWAESEEPLILPDFVDMKSAQRMTLNEAIAVAIKNNLGIALKNEELSIAKSNLRARRGSYEPKLAANFDYNNSVSPPATSQDGEAGSTFKNIGHRWSVALQQNLNVGTSFALSFFNNRSRSDLGTAVQPLNYGTNLSFSAEQPLLRGFSLDGDVPRAPILRAEFANQKSLEDKRGVIAAEVRRTEESYWNLVQATRAYGVTNASLVNARQQLDLTQRQVQAGILAPADLIGSETSVAQRELELMQAETNLEAAMDGLRHTLNLPQDKWSQSLLATDLPTITPRSVTLDEAMRDALMYRHEIKLNAIDMDLSELDERLARNNRLPDLSVGMRYGLAGQSDVYRDSLDQLQSLGARDWAVFVNLSWAPLGREASANRDTVLSANTMVKLRHQQFLNSLRNEVRTSLRALEATRRRVTASEKFRLLAERSLEAERNRFLDGKSRNLDVSLREQSLAGARTAVISARIEFVKASSDLDLATGRLLERKNIQLGVR
jgi:outer membrane protein TolC